jgi:hypothetical protein
MGCTFNTHGSDDKCIQNFDVKVAREETTWKTWGMDVRIILK